MDPTLITPPPSMPVEEWGGLYPQQIAILKDYYGESLSDWEREVVDKDWELRKGRPQLTDRAQYHMGLMAHIVLYGSEDGTEVQEEGLEDRIYAFHEWVRKYIIPTQEV